MTSRRRHLKVFLCHASEDKSAVRDLYHRLSTDGADAWLDEEKLLPGQSWREEIPRVIHNSDVVIVFLSSKSVKKEGYIQKEIRQALDAANERPEETIFLIPAKLEECETPEELKKWQWVDLFKDDGYQRLINSLRKRAIDIDASPVKTHPKLQAVKGDTKSVPLKRHPVEIDSQQSALEEKRKTNDKIEAVSKETETKKKHSNPRRINPVTATIIGALIGLAGTIIAALIESPTFFDWFKNTPVPSLATPLCMSSEDILVKVHVLRSNNTEITTLTPGATFYIEPGLTVYFQVELISVNDIDLSSPECSWVNTGNATDGKLLHSTGCRIDYQAGLKKITDSISLQLSQSSCIALPPYPFFIKSQ